MSKIIYENTLNKQILEFQKAFEKSKRDNDTTFFKLKDNSPEWMTDVIRGCHNGCMPCDLIYDGIVTMLDGLIGYDFDDTDTYEAITEIAQNDFINNFELWTWARDFRDSTDYIEEVQSEFGPTEDILSLLMLARELWLERIGYAIVENLKEE